MSGEMLGLYSYKLEMNRNRTSDNIITVNLNGESNRNTYTEE